MEPTPVCYANVMSGVRRAEHIYYKLERPYLFAVSAHSALPIVQISPNDSVGVLAPITRQPPPGIADELRRLEALPSLSDLPLAETAAHAVRVLGLQTQDPVLRGECFERADAMYRSILRACAHPSLTALAEDDAAKAMSTKLVVAAPVADLLAVPEDRRRLASHCLAGLSLCTLMAQRDPRLCFGFASAAVNWEPHRPLELANMLRIQVLLTGIAYLGMVRGARRRERGRVPLPGRNGRHPGLHPQGLPVHDRVDRAPGGLAPLQRRHAPRRAADPPGSALGAGACLCFIFDRHTTAL